MISWQARANAATSPCSAPTSKNFHRIWTRRRIAAASRYCAVGLFPNSGGLFNETAFDWRLRLELLEVELGSPPSPKALYGWFGSRVGREGIG